VGTVGVAVPCQGPGGGVRRPSRVLPSDGHENCPVAASGPARDWPRALLKGEVKEVTPWPARARDRRTLSPLVWLTGAWCRSRSTVAVAAVLGMSSSNAPGRRMQRLQVGGQQRLHGTRLPDPPVVGVGDDVGRVGRTTGCIRVRRDPGVRDEADVVGGRGPAVAEPKAADVRGVMWGIRVGGVSDVGRVRLAAPARGLCGVGDVARGPWALGDGQRRASEQVTRHGTGPPGSRRRSISGRERAGQQAVRALAVRRDGASAALSRCGPHPGRPGESARGTMPG
jgi:hypothetical protein